jgi:hypothetical protein
VKNDLTSASILAGNPWTRFWFTPTPITGMKVVRVLSGLLFCAWLLSFLGHQAELFSLNGFFDDPAYKETIRRQRLAERPPMPGVDLPQPSIAPAPIGWSMLYLAGTSDQAFQVLYWASLVVLVLFTLGIGARVTGILTWIVVVSFLANPATSYEADYLLGILAFYLMLGHLFSGVWNGNRSFLGMVFGPCDQMVFARAKGEPRVSYAANFMMRLLQIHFAIIMLTSALHKLQLAEWWAGVALWYPLHPPFQQTAESLQREAANAPTVLFILSILGYAVLAWQLAFPFFAWRSGRVWRGLLLGGAALGWAGSSLLFKLPLFGPFVLIACLSFLRPEDWAALAKRVQWLIGSAAEKAKPAEPARTVSAAVAKESIKK